MKPAIKSGDEILNEFFSGLSDAEDLDQETVQCLVNCFEEGKLTDRNITNKLTELRTSDNDKD